MKTSKQPRAWESECATEVCLPVRVRYQVNMDGELEVTHVMLQEVGFLASQVKLLWMQLPLAEREALQAAAEADAQQATRH